MAGTVTFEKSADYGRTLFYLNSVGASTAIGDAVTVTLEGAVFRPMFDGEVVPAARIATDVFRSVEVYEDGDVTYDGDPELDAGNGVASIAKDTLVVVDPLDKTQVVITNNGTETKVYTVVFVCEV